MNGNLKILLGSAAAATIIASAALATQSTGIDTNAILSTGTAIRDIHAHGTLQIPGMDEDFTAGVDTEGASNVIQQEVRFLPGGTTGWHRHPGLVVLTLAADSGSVEWYDAKCGKTTYHAGDSWTEGTKLHDVVNRSAIDAHFLVTYIVAKDIPQRTDEPAPKCAAALGLL